MNDDGGTIRDLNNGRVVGKTENLVRTFAEHVTKGGPPCLIVADAESIRRLRPHLPEWVETVVEPFVSGHAYAFSMTLDEWKEQADGSTNEG